MECCFNVRNFQKFWELFLDISPQKELILSLVAHYLRTSSEWADINPHDFFKGGRG